MLVGIDELEELAGRYAQLKQSHDDRVELARLAIRIIDSVSSPSFALPLEKDAQSTNGTTTYIYQNSSAYPALFDFIAELLHTTVPVEIERAKFGPGEILVSVEDKSQADVQLQLAARELQKLVHAKRAEIFTKHAGAAP